MGWFGSSVELGHHFLRCMPLLRLPLRPFLASWLRASPSYPSALLRCTVAVLDCRWGAIGPILAKLIAEIRSSVPRREFAWRVGGWLANIPVGSNDDIDMSCLPHRTGQMHVRY